MATNWKKPEPATLTPYMQSYISAVPDGILPQVLERNMADSLVLVKELPIAKLSYRYAPGKWTVPEIVNHIADTERVFSYRMLCIARNDKTPLPGFDEEEYARIANVNERSFADILEEWKAVRRATICLLNSMNDDIIHRSGIANNLPYTVLQIGYMIAGHELHHMKVIRERYL